MRIVSKRRLATTSLGIILAVAIIFSMFTLGNNAAKSQLYTAVERSPYHIMVSATMNLSKLDNVLSDLSEIPHVSKVSAVLFTTCNLNISNENITTFFYYLSDAPSKIGSITGRLPKDDWEIAISKDFSENFGIYIGNIINITYWKGNTTVKSQVKVVGIINKYTDKNYSRFEILATPHTLLLMGADNIYILIKVDTDYLVKSGDANEVNKKLWNVQSDVENVLNKYTRDYNINIKFDFYPNVLITISYLIFSLPIITMGAYLSKVGIEIVLTERRREFGILRIRGATDWLRFKLILYEGIIYSIIGGVIGYILGEAIAYTGNMFIFKLPYFSMDLSPIIMLMGIIIALFLFFISLYKPWTKIKNTPMVDLISHYSHEFKKVEYSPGKDVVITLLLWSYIISGIYVIKNTSFEGGFNIMIIIALIIMSTLTFMFPIIFVVLPLSMSRLLTLGTQRVYQKVTDLLSKIGGVAGELVKMGVKRNPKNMAYIAFILSFILTFSTFISATYDNLSMMNELNRIKVTGGDFKIDNPSSTAITKLKQSTNVTKMCILYAQEGSLYGTSVSLWYTNFNNYTKTVYLLNYFIKDGKIKPGYVVIDNELAKKYDLKVGDEINVYAVTYREGEENRTLHKYKISAIMYSIPGTDNFGGDILINEKPNSFENTEILIKARDYKALKKELDDMGIEYEEKKIYEDKYIGAFLTTIQTFLIFIGAAAIFIIQYSLYFNRRGEISLYKVRGAASSQITKILLIEGGAIIIISLCIGSLTGLALAYSTTSFFYISSQIPSIFILGENFLTVTFSMTLIFFIVQYILSLIFSRVKPSEIIRGLGGEM